MAPLPVPYAPPVTLADEERTQLAALARAHSTPQALAFRCRLIVRAAASDHPSHLRLAAEMRCERHTVRLWRTRSLAQGLAGLQEAPRPGRPRRFSPLGTPRCPVARDEYPGSPPQPSAPLER
jgi:Winged helix-turn helix